MMRIIPAIAFGAALALGGATAGMAAKKDKAAAPAGPSFKMSKEFRNAAAPVQVAMKAVDYPGALTALAAADAVATQPDDKYIAGQLRYQIATAQKDVPMQRTAITAMLASGSAPAELVPQLNLAAGNAAYQAGDFAGANQFLARAEQTGAKSDQLYLLLAESNFKANQIPAGLAYVDKAIAAKTATGQKAEEAWYARAASVAYKAKLNAEASKWTRAQVKAYPTPENWRSALVIYRDSAERDGGLNLDLYRLMRLTKSLAGERDYYEYAELASERGLPGEAKAVIDEGMATSAVPSTSRALGELRKSVNAKVAGDRSSLASFETKASSAPTGKIAANTADAYLGYGDNAKAASLYRVALQKGSVDADALNTRLGIALARSGQKEEARQAFTAVTGPRADIAQFWLTWLDQPTA